ncbi:MAG: TRAP transporter small permease [Spirochaetae bacterium HGW-Spirochaetae-4]|nr:MAG: TRAP transporter small permease [Spirochaetae bacterium HGW-Spirochaetae-8]PKL22051.1 MAG: TRAP transporter small permease [Spirochaetae bacterium HGW-Spirochaetae-4]
MKKLLAILNSFEDYVAPAFFAIMCVAVAAQIFFRIVLKRPLLYTEEIARFSYVWCVYICIAMGEKYQDHFAVDVFVKFLKGKPNLLLHVIEKSLGSYMFAVMFFWSVKFFSFQKILQSPAFGVSMSVVAASMCVGFFLAFIRRGVHLVVAVKLLFKKTESMQPVDTVKE